MTEKGNEIIERILQSSQATADAVLAEAEKKAAVRLQEEKTALEATQKAAITARDASRQRQIHAAQSAAALEVRNAQLTTRRVEIDRTLDETLRYLQSLPADEYFAMLSALITAHREGDGGELLLSAADLARVPVDFADSLGVTLCRTPAAISGGCILRWGDIEENLTFEALMDERRDRLEDVVCRELWGE